MLWPTPSRFIPIVSSCYGRITTLPTSWYSTRAAGWCAVGFRETAITISLLPDAPRKLHILWRVTLAPKAWLNHGLPGCKPGLTNQTFLLIVKQGLPDLAICAKSQWLTRVFLVSLVSLVILRTRTTRLKPGSWNSEWTTLTRLEPYVQKAWLTMVFLVSLARLVNQALPGS